ncbi:MAG: SusC/RagA family TonB-linked outer membrane protein [Bacteroidota bacterium]
MKLKRYYKFMCLTVLMLLTLSFQVLAQEFTVSGRITDEVSGDPLPGVNVVIKGTTNGTISDADGNFKLTVSSSPATLTFSFIGYKGKEVDITSSSTNIEVTMSEDITNLEEVVVTGLASSIKRSNLANAVETISAEELLGTTTPQTLGGGLYGKLAGVNINVNGGAPGTSPSVQLRGISTLGNGSSEPLYIIDGVYVNNSSISTGISVANGAGAGQSAALQDDLSSRISDINPDDIESIEILKGSSAAAIYGTRANAGVIIITTKKGRSGKTKVSLGQEIGFNQAVNLLGYADWNLDKVVRFFGGSSQRINDINSGRSTDWEREIFGEEGLITSTTLTVSGGNDKTQFFINGNVRAENGIIQNSGFDRNTIRANIDHQLTDKIKISTGSNYIWSSNDRSFNGNQNSTGASFGYNISFTPPMADLFPDENGIYPNNPYFAENPLALRDLGINNSTVNRFIQSFNADIGLIQTPNSLLKLTFQGGIDYLNSNSLVYLPEVLQFQQSQANPGDVFQGRAEQLNINMQAFLIYNTQVGSVNFNTQVGAVKLNQDSESVVVRGQGLLNGNQNANTAALQSVFRQQRQEVTDVGIVAQEEINWEDKIIGTLGVRLDKSSLNLDQDEFYAFPKASVAVNLNNFGFLNVDQISQLKVRAAYGETGGLPNFGTTFIQLNNQFIDGGAGTVLSTVSVDPNLEPETAREIELGLDVGLFDGRALLEVTYYDKQINDLIEFLEPANSTGIIQITTNAGDLKNTGWELALSGSPIRTPSVEWFSRVNWWTNESEITRWDVPAKTTGGFGASLGTYQLAEGISPTTIVGNPELQDANGNGIGQFTRYGDAQPDWQLSFYNQVNFLKNFTFSFVLHHSSGADVINLSQFLWDLGGTSPDWDDTDQYANQPAMVDGEDNPLFRDDNGDGVNDLTNGQGRPLQRSTEGSSPEVYIQDASFWKIREAGLYYTLPSSVTNSVFKGFVEKVKLGVSGNHLFIFSDYVSYDPEVSQFGANPVASSVEVTPFPSSRRVMFHLNIDF